MAIDQPGFFKPSIVLHRNRNEHMPAQEPWDQYLADHLSRVARMHWTLGEDQVTVQFYAGPPALFVTIPLLQVYHAFRHQEARLRRLVALLESGEVQRLETVFDFEIPAEGVQSIWVEARIDVEADGEEKVTFTFLHQGSQPQEAIYPIGLDEIPLGMLFVEPQTGTIIDANASALELLSVLDDDLSNIRWQRSPDWLDFIQQVNEQSNVWNRMLEVSAGKVWALFSAQRVNDQIIVFAQDVSSLQLQIQTLQKVNVGLDSFVYHASHDLRAPLRSMQGLITLLRTETNAKERDKFVELIEASINRLDAFLVDLLSISRSNRPERRPMVKINFMVEVEKAVSSFFHLGDTTNLEIITRISQPVRFVSDLTQVRVILNNIISNAFKYRRYGVRRSRIKIEIRVTRKRAHIRISDNGEGIAEEHLPHIFEMFYRATDRSEGSGLGLYIVRETVEKLKGTIGIKSRPNRGTIFTVILPNQYQSTKNA